MSETKAHNTPANLGITAKTAAAFVAKNRMLFYAAALFLTLLAARFGSDGRHPLLSAFIAGIGAGIAFTTVRLSRR
jgi:hypothetical protein